MIESSLIRNPTSPSSLPPPVSLALPAGDPLVPSPAGPFPSYPYSSYLNHLTTQHSAMSPDSHFKSYFPEHLKQYLPDHLKPASFPEHLKPPGSFPDHLKQYLVSEHFRNMMMNDPLRLYIAQHELANAASTAIASGSIFSSGAEDLQVRSPKGCLFASSANDAPLPHQDGGSTTSLRKLQEKSSGGGANSSPRNSLFSIESLLAPPKNTSRISAPMPRPPTLDLFCKYIACQKYFKSLIYIYQWRLMRIIGYLKSNLEVIHNSSIPLQATLKWMSIYFSRSDLYSFSHINLFLNTVSHW